MEILFNLTKNVDHLKPAALTIGNFDGLHLGHQAVINRVKELAQKEQEHSIVLTFLNHPSEVLNPDKAVSKLCTQKHKIKLLDELGIDAVILLRFTQEFSRQTAEEFLKKIYERFPFKHLILGHDAVMGKDRQGNPEQIKKLAQSLNFQVQYISPYLIEGKPVSSSSIREALRTGNLQDVEKMLGRKYSIYSNVGTGKGKGRGLGFPTANIDTDSLCLPPLGVYAVSAKVDGKTFPGVANLGIAPTVRDDGKPILEVHLFDRSIDLYGKDVEVNFHGYIRPEKKFSDLTHLKERIGLDIEEAKFILRNDNAN